MGSSLPSELTYLMGFHQVTAEAASEYVLSSDKPKPGCLLRTTWISFPGFDSDINIRHTFFRQKRVGIMKIGCGKRQAGI